MVNEPDRKWQASLLRIGGWVLLVLVTAVAGVVLGLRLAGPVEHETALGDVELRVAPALHGKVDAFIPLADWGIRADAFSAPLVIHVRPRSIDRQAVIRAAGGDRQVLASAQAGAERAAAATLRRAAIWALAGVLALALLVAALVWRRGRRFASATAAAIVLLGAAVIGGALLRTDRTFDAAAFESPSFYARGAELGQLLAVAGRAGRAENAYRSQVDRTISSYAELLSAGGRTGLSAPGRRAVLVSDLHANTLVLDTVQRLATGSPVFFVGDFAQSGTDAEARTLVPRITGLGQVVAVSGNHDSRGFMRALARGGATVLTETGRIGRDGAVDGRPVQEIGGLQVAGYSDPLESRTGDPNDPDRIFSFSERPEGDREYAEAKAAFIAWFRTLAPRPHVVLVHHFGLAAALGRALQEENGPPLLVLTGHDHVQHVDRYGSTLVVDAGTVGAGGILGAGKDSIGVAQLELDEGQAWPRLIDLVALEPLSGAARADRVLPASPDICEGGVVQCHDVDEEEPAGTPEEPTGR